MKKRKPQYRGHGGNKHRVIELHKLHPDWNSVDIAEALGPNVDGAYVRATFQRNGLKLATRRSESLIALGRAARLAGFTVAELKELAMNRDIYK